MFSTSITHTDTQTLLESDLEKHTCRQARLARDPRFDGLFFIGVFSTGIYCRPICPAVAPKEENVKYFRSAVSAAQAGLRPCLRCRPDSAPMSYAWKGTQTTLDRAVNLIDSGVMSGDNGLSVEAMAERLGISGRYLRQLFQQGFGISPKQYASYRQLLFAKQLLHQTQLSITEIALASGFTSIRRFNQVFKESLSLTPSDVRKQVTQGQINPEEALQLVLYQSYRPPLDWARQWAFYQLRAVEGMEWLPNANTYCRSFAVSGIKGWFVAEHQPNKYRFKLTLHLHPDSQLTGLSQLLTEFRRILDLDADMMLIEQGLSYLQRYQLQPLPGLRLPGAGSTFEALCRAILGQQVSVVQATKLLTTLVENYGEQLVVDGRPIFLFPTPDMVAKASLDELKMPGSRKLALNGMAQFLVDHPESRPEQWLDVKGIGPWTVAYAQMRGMGLPNVFLATDLIVKKRLLQLQPLSSNSQAAETTKKAQDKYYQTLSEDAANSVSPWGSYLTFQLWNLGS